MERRDFSVPRNFRGLWHYVERNDYRMVITLLDHDEGKAQVNDKQLGYTLLHLASLNHHQDIMQTLLARGADPNNICKARSPLYLCVLYGEIELVRLLLSYGADPNIPCGGIYPIHLAASKGLVELITLLSLYKADMSPPSTFGTPLHVAAKLDHRYIAQELIDQNASLSAVNSEGESVLYTACKYNHEPFAEIILSQMTLEDASLQEYSEQLSVVHLCAKSNQKDTLLKLMETFPSLVLLRNKLDKTAFFYMQPKLRTKVRHLVQKSIWKTMPPLSRMEWTDCVLQGSDGFELGAHRLILESRSPTLAAKLSKGDSILAINLNESVLRELYHFLYADKVGLLRNAGNQTYVLKELQKFAQDNEMETLDQLCEHKLKSGVQPPKPSLVSALSTLLKPPCSHSDVTITVRDEDVEKEYYCHKAILTLRSEFFGGMFNPRHSLIESNASTALLDDLSPVIFEKVLNYLYTGLTNPSVLSPDTALEVLEASARLVIPSLFQATQFFLIDHIEEANVLAILATSERYNATLLFEECLDLVIRDYLTYSKEPAYKELPTSIREQVTQFFSHD
eukprot:TRINITY_DN9332_c0_g1_i1.p1 TRINITY_DN9332_c0_g1~~TRINITY_DN9332_c0_g1_i1.p1  ORF type:complete len:567 (-),score=69.34 TRINITY_DN9332_c0_g1_i1:63-1763(-)